MEHSSDRDIENLNCLPNAEAENELLKCCGSRNWARRMVAERPFVSLNKLFDSADQIWWSLEPSDWLEAFHSHPKIGEKKAAAAVAVEAQKWSEDEQSGISDSAPETIDALAQLNREYEEKFGYIFIVCASGKVPKRCSRFCANGWEMISNEGTAHRRRRASKDYSIEVKKTRRQPVDSKAHLRSGFFCC